MIPMLPSCIYLGICEQQILINALHVGRGKPVEGSQPCCFPSEGMAWAALAPMNFLGNFREIENLNDGGRVSFYLLKIQLFVVPRGSPGLIIGDKGLGRKVGEVPILIPFSNISVCSAPSDLTRYSVTISKAEGTASHARDIH